MTTNQFVARSSLSKVGEMFVDGIVSWNFWKDGDLCVRIFFSITALLLAGSVFYRSWQRQRRMPPGPMANWIPFVGCLPLLLLAGRRREPHVNVCRLAQKHGKIFRLEIGSTTMVVIADHKLLRETFKREDLTRRNNPPSLDVMDGMGIIQANGDLWKNQRQFVHGVLRNLGMVRTSTARMMEFERKAEEAIAILLDEITRTDGQEFDIDLLLSFAAVNMLCLTLMTTHFQMNDPDVMAMIQSSHDSFRDQNAMALANFIPAFQYLPSFRKMVTTIMKRRDDCFEFFRKIIEKRRRYLDPNNPCPDLIDAFLIQMESDKNEGKTCSYFTETQLLAILGDLFSAGIETTKTTMQWLLLALLHHPDIQTKMQDEIDDTCGKQCSPSLDDRSRLPYVEAVIQETFRFSSIVPFGVAHSGIEDTTIAGYHIPREAMVTGLMWKFHRDPELWKNPNRFDPKNQLNDDGRSVRRCDYLMPFSTGRRICLGEDIARNEIFLLTTALLQKFSFLPAKKPLPSLDESVTGVLRCPSPYKMRAVLRL